MFPCLQFLADNEVDDKILKTLKKILPPFQLDAIRAFSYL